MQREPEARRIKCLKGKAEAIAVLINLRVSDAGRREGRKADGDTAWSAEGLKFASEDANKSYSNTSRNSR